MKKIWLFLLTFAFISACASYQPLLSVVSNGVYVAEVKMANPNKNVGERRIAQAVRQNLLKSFPVTNHQNYVLTVSIEETETTLAIEQDATAERLRLLLNAVVLLKQRDNKILSTDLSADAAFNVEDTPFSTESGRTFAREAAARTLSQVITQEVTLAVRAHQNQTMPKE